MRCNLGWNLAAAVLVLAPVHAAQTRSSDSARWMPPGLAAAVQAALAPAEYTIVPGVADPLHAWTAENCAQGFCASFTADGVRVAAAEDDSKSELFSLRLVEWGCGRDLVSPEPAELAVLGARVEYRRGDLIEWYVNSARGLEQGFTITEAPRTGAATTLELRLALDGDLAPELASDGRALLLCDATGTARLAYSELAAWDANGQPLAARLELSPGAVSILVDVEAAAFPVTVDPLLTSEEGKLVASDATVGANLGFSVSLSGDSALAGAMGDNSNTGTAYVFVRNGTSWSQQARLDASDAASGDLFGASVAIFGDTAIVGATYDNHAGGMDAGSAYVFVRSGTSWSQQAKLVASDAAADDHFGNAVALSGDTAVVGSAEDNHAGGMDAGSAYVFVRSGTVWSQQQKLVASDASGGAFFGGALCLDGENLIAGAQGDNHAGVDSGSAYVFVRSGTSWSEQAKLTASDAAASDGFGGGVGLSSETTVVGSLLDSHAGGVNAGSAYVFVRSGTSWSEQQKLIASDAGPGDLFGISVSVVGDTVLVGSIFDDHSALIHAGSAYVFVRNGTSWTEQPKLIASDAADGDAFGVSVFLSGDTALVGAEWDDHAGGMDAGSAYVYRLDGSIGTKYCTANANSTGLPADISASGSSSSGAGDLLLTSAPVPNQNGIFFHGMNQAQNPFGNGFLCTTGGIVRGAVTLGAGNIATYAYDNSGAKHSLAAFVGSTRQFQHWFRDPAGGGSFFNLSNAISIAITP